MTRIIPRAEGAVGGGKEWQNHSMLECMETASWSFWLLAWSELMTVKSVGAFEELHQQSI